MNTGFGLVIRPLKAPRAKEMPVEVGDLNMPEYFPVVPPQNLQE